MNKFLLIALIAFFVPADTALTSDYLNFQCTPSGERCMMPFTYDGTEYSQCALTSLTMWCPTGPLPNGGHEISQCTLCEAPSMCYMRADEIPTSLWKIDCPPGCANITKRLWTSRKDPNKDFHSVDSFVCAAAIQERRINDAIGGTVAIRKSGNTLHKVEDGNFRSTAIQSSKMAPLFSFEDFDEAEEIPPMIFANTRDIRSTHRGSVKVIAKGQENALSIALDTRKNILYWSDVEKRKIYRANLTATSNHVQSMTSLQVKTPEGMAIDWVHDLFFWTDRGLHTVSVCTALGSHPKTLISRDASFVPRAIALDPKRGHMFVTDWGDKAKIEKCSMTGRYCSTVVGTMISWPNGLAIDIENNLMYWADNLLETISVATTDGEFRRELLSSPTIVSRPFSVVLYSDRLYWTDWKRGILSVNKDTGEEVHLHMMGLDHPSGIAFYDRTLQPAYPNRCRYSSCKYLCLPDTYGSRCACPDGFAALGSTDCTPLPSLADQENVITYGFAPSIEETFDVKEIFEKENKKNRKGYKNN